MKNSSTKPEFRLSAQQLRVVGHRGSHLQVIACAGSGKTESISRRVAALFDEGAKPDSIVAFTFTERAASELKDRIYGYVAASRGKEYLGHLGPMFVGTIHAYCFRLLQDHVAEYGNYDVLDENRHAGLLSREYRRLGLGDLGTKHWAPIRDFIRTVDIIGNELIEPEQLGDSPLRSCFEAYLEMLDRFHYLTFGQIIAKAIKALGRPEVFERVHAPLRHLIVDEYQDINPAQERLIEFLATDPVELCVVGDDDQSIYQWRGADVGNILTFARRFGEAQTISLSTNRRSCSDIVEHANRFAETIEPRLEKTMNASRESDGVHVVPWRVETDESEADTIADTIERLHTDGHPYRSIAVLYRSVRTSAPPLIDALRERGIPFTCAGRTGLFLLPEISVLGQLYAWLVDADWRNERYGEAQAVELTDLISGFDSLFELSEPAPLFRRYLEDWKAMVSVTNRPVSLIGDLYRLLRRLSVHELDLDSPGGSTRAGTLARFSQILADFENVTRRGLVVEEDGARHYRGGTDRGKPYYQRLFNYLQHYARDAYEDFEGEDQLDTDAVDILTIHKAKGLEWPIVFIPALVEGRFPSRRAGQSQDWLLSEEAFPAHVRARYEGSEAEERRLFYVALTRARDVVYLSTFERKVRSFTPSRFLVDLVGPTIAQPEQLPLPQLDHTASDEEAPITVSFSEIASYEECGHRYRLRSALGFESEIAVELGYGRAIHHVLRSVAEIARTTGEIPAPDVVAELLHREFYLPFANRPAYERLQNAAKRLVEVYLEQHADDLRRVWATERPFELSLDVGLLTGRADVILDEEGDRAGSLAIVDYKTATDDRADDLFAFQLAVYAAAGRGEGLDIQAAYLHQLRDSVRSPIDVSDAAAQDAVTRVIGIITSLRQADYPASPERGKCGRCALNRLCSHADCDPLDLE